VTTSVIVGVAMYAALFTWLGLVSTQAIGVGLLYIVLWEGFFAGFVSGARMLSIRYYSIALMHAMDPRRFAAQDHVSALTASIAHEVNQPLSGIVTNASTCLRMLAADPPNVEGARETARRTIRDGNRASEVIARLRALFTKKEPAAESVDLNEATREVIALSLSELQRNRVVVRAELTDDLPRVMGDRVQLQQVILNLLLNGSDAMRGVDRPRELMISTGPDGDDRVRLVVQDAGVGFTPDGADKLFDAFYTTKDGGMGIGLSVSRSIIDSHFECRYVSLS